MDGNKFYFLAVVSDQNYLMKYLFASCLSPCDLSNYSRMGHKFKPEVI